MSFLKRLFSKKKNESDQSTNEKPTALKSISTTAHFEQRYSEETIDDAILDGSLKMVKSYFMDNKIPEKIENPINHPLNLDEIVNEGMGFHMYCKAFELDDSMVISFLAFAYSDYMIKNHGFKFYKDHTPEFPLRSMTLKYDNDGAVLSLYPYEYALKVLNYEATFEAMTTKVKNHLDNLPTANQLLKRITDQKED